MDLRLASILAFLCTCTAYTLLPVVRPAVPAVAAHRFPTPIMQEADDEQPPVEEPEAPGDVEEDAASAPPPAPAPMPELTDDDIDFMGFADADDTEASIAKEALKTEISGGLTANAKPDRAVVGEILLALEAANPTASPATSPLLNGKWKFLYASGTSPGLKALQLLLRSAGATPKSPSGADLVDVADTYLTIREGAQPRATAEVTVRLLSLENTFSLSSKLEPESAVRLAETYDAASASQPSFTLPFQSAPAQYKRSVLVSYLDEELLVVRDAVGRADVLMRVSDPPFTAAAAATVAAPAAADDEIEMDISSTNDDAPSD